VEELHATVKNITSQQLQKISQDRSVEEFEFKTAPRQNKLLRAGKGAGLRLFQQTGAGLLGTAWSITKVGFLVKCTGEEW